MVNSVKASVNSSLGTSRVGLGWEWVLVTADSMLKGMLRERA